MSISFRRARDVHSGTVVTIGRRRVDGQSFGLAIVLPFELCEDVLRLDGRDALRRLYALTRERIAWHLDTGEEAPAWGYRVEPGAPLYMQRMDPLDNDDWTYVRTGERVGRNMLHEKSESE